MPDKKLTDNLSNKSPILSNGLSDNEIVKALECCSNPKARCGGCSFYGKGSLDTTCSMVLMGNALDLINRLQAEKSNLEVELKAMRGAANGFKADNERLQAECGKGANALIKLMIENRTAKAEAYKECIEKVKENSNKMELVCSGALVRTDYTITKEKLDNLLKELVGEDND